LISFFVYPPLTSHQRRFPPSFARTASLKVLAFSKIFYFSVWQCGMFYSLLNYSLPLPPNKSIPYASAPQATRHKQEVSDATPQPFSGPNSSLLVPTLEFLSGPLPFTLEICTQLPLLVLYIGYSNLPDILRCSLNLTPPPFSSGSLGGSGSFDPHEFESCSSGSCLIIIPYCFTRPLCVSV